MKPRTLISMGITWAVALILSSFLACYAFGDIVAKDSYKAGEPIVVKVEPTAAPEGATVRVAMTITGVGGVWQPTPETNTLGVWGYPGKHTLNASCAWIKSGEGGPSLVIEQFQKDIVIGGSGPTPPDPVDPPDPDDPQPPPMLKWQVGFILEMKDLESLPLSQVELVSGLAFRDELKSKGHVFFRALDRDESSTIMSKCEDGVCSNVLMGDEYKAWFDAVKGKSGPYVLIAPKAGGKVQSFPLPANRAELYKLLDEAKDLKNP
jgi:hypothetical protein